MPLLTRSRDRWSVCFFDELGKLLQDSENQIVILAGNHYAELAFPGRSDLTKPKRDPQKTLWMRQTEFRCLIPTKLDIPHTRGLTA